MAAPAQQPLFVPRILWAALTASVGIYSVIPLLVPMSNAEPPPTVVLFACVALVTAVMSFVLPKLMYSSALSRVTFDVVERPVTEAPSGYRNAAGTFRVLEPSFRKRAVALYTTKLILELALSESVGLMGLVAVLVGHPYWVGVPFFGASFVLLAMRFPTERAYVAPVEQAANAVAPPS